MSTGIITGNVFLNAIRALQTKYRSRIMHQVIDGRAAD